MKKWNLITSHAHYNALTKNRTENTLKGAKTFNLTWKNPLYHVSGKIKTKKIALSLHDPTERCYLLLYPSLLSASLLSLLYQLYYPPEVLQKVLYIIHYTYVIFSYIYFLETLHPYTTLLHPRMSTMSYTFGIYVRILPFLPVLFYRRYNVFLINGENEELWRKVLVTLYKFQLKLLHCKRKSKQ